MSRHKRLLLTTGAIALLMAVVRPPRPHADFTIVTHRPDDAAPQRVHAAIDLGILAISVVVTWSSQLAR
ncbi:MULTISPECIES: hypothetical protein [Sphingomonas]|uniref:hypothetical protein n=1 Tax=Sphingomonas TaxID=13687 RepID=UPI000835D1C2|nr:hypothetical protein [Sphingomonas pituitosa]